jgi:hypothetical protein
MNRTRLKEKEDTFEMLEFRVQGYPNWASTADQV